MENAPARIAAALAQCPEAACRRYLPHGRGQGRYRVAGDLLDLIRHRIGAGTPRPAPDEARAFLALLRDLGAAAGRTFAVGRTIRRRERAGWMGRRRADHALSWFRQM